MRQMRHVVFSIAIVTSAMAFASPVPEQQVVDTDFKVMVDRPAYRANGPTVAIDEAHANFHTAAGQYKPFAELLTADGYRVVPFTRKFAAGAFDGIRVLVIANANAQNFTDSVFTDAECDAVRDWVRAGGSLLLIADHAPFGTSAANLAARFGVSMGRGWAFDVTPTSVSTQLTFSRDNGLLGMHPILRGRDSSEEIRTVRTFTGQSLGGPDGASILLRLSETAREAPMTDDLDAEAKARASGAPIGARSKPAGGRAQGMAMITGQGRVAVFGEAAMFSAQVVTLPDGDRQVVFKAGMNAPGNDNRQLALNVLHWLTGVLP
jgi:hypothetical protein